MGMKVFTDDESQFLARVFQTTASNLKMEPVQTDATQMQTTIHNSTGDFSQVKVLAQVQQSDAADLHATIHNSTGDFSQVKVLAQVQQSDAADLHATIHNSTGNFSQVKVLAQVQQSDATDLHATIHNSTGDFSQVKVLAKLASSSETNNVKLADRATFTSLTQVNVTQAHSPGFTAAGTTTPIAVISLSQFNFFIENGSATANLRIELAPTSTGPWQPDVTTLKTLAAEALTIYTPTRFSKWVRLAYQQGSDNDNTDLNIYAQGQV